VKLAPSLYLFSPSTFNENLDSQFLKWFKDNIKKFSFDTTPQGLGAGIVSYSLGANMVLMEGMLV